MLHLPTRHSQIKTQPAQTRAHANHNLLDLWTQDPRQARNRNASRGETC